MLQQQWASLNGTLCVAKGLKEPWLLTTSVALLIDAVLTGRLRRNIFPFFLLTRVFFGPLQPGLNSDTEKRENGHGFYLFFLARIKTKGAASGGVQR